MVNVHYASPVEVGKLAEALASTHEFLCPDCGQFLVTQLVERRPFPEQRRCLVECSQGHRYLAPYD